MCSQCPYWYVTADPNGEFLSGKHAGPVYELFGKTGVGVDEQPPLNHPVGDSIGYHIRTGKHDVTQYDCDMAWATYYQEIVSHRLSPRLTQTFSLTIMRGVYMTECGCGMFGRAQPTEHGALAT